MIVRRMRRLLCLETRGVIGTSRMSVVRSEDRSLLSEECEVLERWKGYFERLFRIEDSVQGVVHWAETSFEDPNSGVNEEYEIEMGEIVRALRSMKMK